MYKELNNNSSAQHHQGPVHTFKTCRQSWISWSKTQLLADQKWEKQMSYQLRICGRSFRNQS